MHDGQCERGDRHHGALQDHERDLVIGETAVEPALQLRDTEDGTDVD